MKIKNLLTIVFCCFSFLAISQQTVNITFVSDGRNAGAQSFETRVKAEIQTLLQNKYKVEFSELNGNFDATTIQTYFNQAQENPNIDFVIASGLLSSEIALNTSDLKKPTQATFVFDADLSGSPKKGNASGINNLTYLEVAVDSEKDLKLLNEVYSFKKVGVVIPNIDERYIDAFRLYFDNISKSVGKNYEFIDINNITAEIAAKKVDAIYFTSFGNLDNAGILERIQEVNQLKLPSFTMFGREYVEMGILAGNTPEDNFDIRARRIAINVLKSVEGQNPSTFNVEFPPAGDDFVINMMTAEAIDYYPNFDILGEADLINITEQFTDNTYNLRKVIIEALNENLDIKTSSFDITLADQEIKNAIADYFPQGSISLTGAAVDNGLTNLGIPRAPFSLSSNLSLQQAILNIPAISNIIISKLQKEVQTHAYKQQELDVIYQSAQAYLNILLAKSNVRIQNENVSVTRSNLKISEQQVNAGYKGESDRLRFESQFALNKIDLNNALAQMNSAKFNLNRYLNNDIDAPFRLEEVDFSDNILMVSDTAITNQINDPLTLEKFANFLVDEAFRNLPELKQIESALEVQNRAAKWQKAAFGVPQISGNFGLDYSFYNSGPMADQLTYPRPFWNSGFSVSLPISTGGKNFIQKQTIQVNIEKLNTQKENTQQLLELQIRSNLENVGASFSRMILAEEAATAARQNLAIAQDNYSKGIITIITLIDAQNATLQAEVLEATSLYNFYLDFLSVERSIGFFYSLATEEEKTDFRNRMNEFMITKQN